MADDTLSANCGCGPRKLKNLPYLGGDDLLITSLSQRCLPKDKSCDCKGSCGCESTREPHGLELAHGLLKRLQAAMSPYCGCPSTGPVGPPVQRESLIHLPDELAEARCETSAASSPANFLHQRDKPAGSAG